MKTQELRKRIASQLEKMIFYDVWQHLELNGDGMLSVNRFDGEVLEGIDVSKTATKVKFPDRLKAIEMLLSIISEEDDREIEISFRDEI